MQQGVGDESVFLEVFHSRFKNYYSLEKWTQNKGKSSQLAIYHPLKSKLELERYIGCQIGIVYLASFRC